MTDFTPSTPEQVALDERMRAEDAERVRYLHREEDPAATVEKMLQATPAPAGEVEQLRTDLAKSQRIIARLLDKLIEANLL